MSKLTLIGILFSLTAPSFASAAITYSRTPSGASLPWGSITFNVSADNFSDFGLNPVITHYYLTTDADYTSDGICRAVSSPVNFSETLATPESGGPAFGMAIYAFDESGCTHDVPNNFYYLEGNGSSVIFTVSSKPGVPIIPKGIVAHRPEVTINFPKTGDFIGIGTTTIRYSAEDQDNFFYPPFGFGESPIDIYYSDDKENWIRIVEKTKNLGEYAWNTSNLQEGGYWLKISARDESGESDEEISGPFSLDTISPLFDVSVDPAVSRGESVKITIKASEPLKESPEVFVRQRGYVDIQVFPRLSKSDFNIELLKSDFNKGEVWEGIYEVRSGADGTAKISVKGKDLAGNTGNIIRKGGFFSVGSAPPPTPVIINPLDNDVVATSTISIRGRIREDTKAVIFVNEIKAGEALPNEEGDFVAENISLSKDANRGLNLIKIFSEDRAGNTSEPAVLNVKFNLAPRLSILEPSASATTSATTTIIIEGRDENSDRLSYMIEACLLGEVGLPDGSSTSKSLECAVSFQEIVKDFPRPEYEWNTREFPDGEYILRVTASDGFERVSATSSRFFVRNFLPVIEVGLPDGSSTSRARKFHTNKTSLVLRGLATSPFSRGGGEKRDILKVEMSEDGGKTWQGIKARDGSYDSPSEEFTLNLQNLIEGGREILLRAFDTSRLRGRAKVLVTADFAPPAMPIVEIPKFGEVFGDKEDVNPDKAGVQVLLKGRAEADSRFIITGIGKPSTGSTGSPQESSGNNGSSPLTTGIIIVPEFIEGHTFSDGSFSAEVTLSQHKENRFEIIVEDRAGNRSSTTGLTILRNNPPDIKFLRPREGGGLSHKAEILFEIQDRDLDAIKETALFYRRVDEETQRFVYREVGLPDGSPTSKYLWDVSAIPEGRYELILEASDGVSKNSATREIFVDNTAPNVNFVPLEKSSFSKEFTLVMTGTARDEFSGIEFLEYSIDQKNWYKATITWGFRGKEAQFRVNHPFKLDDGTYQISFRAVDSAGNVSLIPEPQKIIVDTTAPRIGSYTLTFHSLNILPQGETFEIPEGTELKFTISLEGDSASSTIYIGGQSQKLEKQAGLWTTELKFEAFAGKTAPGKTLGVDEGTPSVGEGVVEEANALTAVHISASDRLGNFVSKEIGKIKMLPKGRILDTESGNPLDQVEINISIFDENTKSWVRWQAEAYGLENPVLTEQDGKYNLLLLSGKYELRLRKQGFKKINISNLEIDNSAFIVQDFKMEPRKGLRGKIEDLLENIGF